MRLRTNQSSGRSDPLPRAGPPTGVAPERRHILLAMRWYRRQLHEGVAAYCREHRWVLDSLDHSPDLSHAKQWDGIILLHQSVPGFAGLLRRRVPVLTLAMDEQGRVRLPSVVQDQEAIGAMGALHLLERGYPKLLFCGYRDGICSARFQGLQQAARQHGAAVRQLVLPHRAPAGAGTDFTQQWLAARLREEEPPFAVLAAHDLLAMTVLDACEAANLRTPEQVAVLGVDNEEIICSCARVPLSSVDNDLFRHGYEAAQLLGRLLEGAAAPAHPILIPPRRVVVRASTDAIAARDSRLARILQHLHEHLNDPTLSVKTLGLRSGLSRRRLETLFEEAGLKPPGQVIHEVRLRRACAQLADGNQTVQQIAKACGFASPGSFGRYFRQVKGVSPEVWRRTGKH